MWDGRGQRIREAREARKLKQDELGKRLGVSRVTIMKWESNDSMEIKAGNLDKLASLFGTDSDWLLHGSYPKRPSASEVRERDPFLRISTRYSEPEKKTISDAYDRWTRKLEEGSRDGLTIARLIALITDGNDA